MPIQPWRATCIQMESTVACNAATHDEAWTIIEGNINRAQTMIRSACEGPKPPKLVVLPEFALQGPPRATPVTEWIAKACTTIPGSITDRFAVLARRYGIFIAGNQFEVDPHWPDRCFNSSFVLDPTGEVILRYRRINTATWTSPHDILDIYLEAYGQDGLFPIADTELGRLSIFPCGEIVVPEIARAFMMRGAEILLHPSNEPITATAEAAKICRAAENKAYLISTNVAGGIGFSVDGVEKGGRSQIVDFTGKVLAIEDTSAETTRVSAMIDVEALRAARRDRGMANGLLRSRWHVYKPLFEKAEFYPANGLADRAMAGPADLDPVLEAALANLEKAGITVPAETEPGMPKKGIA